MRTPTEDDLYRRFDAKGRALDRITYRVAHGGKKTAANARQVLALSREMLAIAALAEDLGYHDFDPASLALLRAASRFIESDGVSRGYLRDPKETR